MYVTQVFKMLRFGSLGIGDVGGEPAEICYQLETLEQLVEDLKLWTGSPGSSWG
jgi:hypothetical protein